MEMLSKEDVLQYSLTTKVKSDRITELSLDNRNLKILLLVVSVALVVAVSICGKLAVSVKSVPIVFFADRQGNVWSGGEGQEVKMDDDFINRVKHTQFTQLIEHWRSVTLDPEYQRRLIVDAKNNVAKDSPAATFLNAWYLENNPLNRLEKETVTTQMISDGPVGPNSYEIWWSETAIPNGSASPVTRKWRAVLSYTLNPPKIITAETKNRLGLYVSQISISPVKE